MKVENISLAQPKDLPFLVKKNETGEVFLITRATKNRLVFTLLSNDRVDINSLIIDDVEFENVLYQLSGYEILPIGTIIQLKN